jgi:hypothetical protein
MFASPIQRILATAGVICASNLLTACGGGGDPRLETSTEASLLTATTLLDDDGGIMPTDPLAIPATPPTGYPRRYATLAQALDLQRALGAEVRWVHVGCCAPAAAAHAVAAALASDTGASPAILVSGDPRSGAEVVDILVAGGRDRVWWVAL